MSSVKEKMIEAIESQIAEVEKKIATHEEQKAFYQTKAIALSKKGQEDTADDYFTKAAVEIAAIQAYYHSLAMFRMLLVKID